MIEPNLYYSTIYSRRGGYSYEQRANITSKMHGGKYLKAEIVRKKGIQNKYHLKFNIQHLYLNNKNWGRNAFSSSLFITLKGVLSYSSLNTAWLFLPLLNLT